MKKVVTFYTRLSVLLRYDENNVDHRKEIEGNRKSYTVTEIPKGIKVMIKITIKYEDSSGQRMSEENEIEGNHFKLDKKVKVFALTLNSCLHLPINL